MTPKETNFPANLFAYDSVTGIITREGKPVGSKNREGYLLVQANKIRVCCHRLAWRLHYGEWPVNEIDHINRNPSDNRIENLRDVTASENLQNRRVMKNNEAGETGVFFDKYLGRWRIVLGLRGDRRYYYASHRLSAVLAARLIRRVLHGEFAFQTQQAQQAA